VRVLIIKFLRILGVIQYKQNYPNPEVKEVLFCITEMRHASSFVIFRGQYFMRPSCDLSHEK